jgi:hypothetical protein
MLKRLAHRSVAQIEPLIELRVAQSPAQLQEPGRRPAIVPQQPIQQIHLLFSLRSASPRRSRRPHASQDSLWR